MRISITDKAFIVAWGLALNSSCLLPEMHMRPEDTPCDEGAISQPGASDDPCGATFCPGSTAVTKCTNGRWESCRCSPVTRPNNASSCQPKRVSTPFAEDDPCIGSQFLCALGGAYAIAPCLDDARWGFCWCVGNTPSQRIAQSGSCGNSALEVGEQCDFNRYDGASCEALFGPQATGYLTCTMPDCKIDTSTCKDTQAL